MKLMLSILIPCLLFFVVTHGEPAPHVVFLVGETNHYGSRESMPKLAETLKKKFDFRVTYIDNELRSQKDKSIKPKSLHGIEALRNADLAVLFLRFREPTDEQVKILEAYLDSGKPAIAFRDTSHLFWQKRKGWFVPYFGGHYTSHRSNADGTIAVISSDNAGHPILRGVEPVMHFKHEGVYNTLPLNDTVTPLIFGKTGDSLAEPVAWVNEFKKGSRLFYTSLGHHKDFGDPSHQNMVLNAVFWCLGKEVPEGGVMKMKSQTIAATAAIPSPPKRIPPADAHVLFDGREMSAWKHYDAVTEPNSQGIDHRAETTSGKPKFESARWKVVDGILQAVPGFGDIVTRQRYGNYELHLDFCIPREPDHVPDDFKGSSGVFLSGRYRIQIADSSGRDISTSSCGAIYGQKAPLKSAAKQPGEWQSLDITYTHMKGQPAYVSVWLNGVQVQKDVAVDRRTPHGFFAPLDQIGGPDGPRGAKGKTGKGVFTAPKVDNAKYNMGGDFTVLARFKTTGSGTLFAKAPLKGQWEPNAKALFLRNGRLVYDIGWLGMIQSKKKYNDNRWHIAVLSVRGKHATIHVDGKKAASRANFTRPDNPAHQFKIGAASVNFGLDFSGRISDVRFYGEGLLPKDAARLSKGKYEDMAPLLDWSPASSVKKDRLTIHNDLDDPVHIYLLMPDETSRKLTTIASGEEQEVESQKGRRWLAMVKDRVVAGFIAGEGEAEWSVEAGVLKQKESDLPPWLVRARKPFAAIEGLKGPIRLKADFSKVRFANIWIRPLAEIDHSGALRQWNEKSFHRGERIYSGLCVNCHGADGITPSQPDARAFGKGEIKFGADPISLFRTLTHGNGKMQAQTWMSPAERYAVVHYIHDKFIKPMNPAYQPADEEYLRNLPKGISPRAVKTPKVKERDFGPALGSQLGRDFESVLSIKLGSSTRGSDASGQGTTISYDLHTMNLAGLWQGSYLNLKGTQHWKLRGGGTPQPAGKSLTGLDRWEWAHDGSFDYPREDLLPRGPLPEKWLRYRGYYVHGNQVVFTYQIDGRAILESPSRQGALNPAIVHRMRIEPGDKALKLCVASFKGDAGILPLDALDKATAAAGASFPSVSVKKSSTIRSVILSAEVSEKSLEEFVAATILGQSKDLAWEVDSKKRLVLNIPPSKEPLSFEVIRMKGASATGMQDFVGLAKLREIRGQGFDLSSLTKGGPSRWQQVVQTKGVLGKNDKPYTLDTLTLPESNPWNVWFRTSAVGFYPDGRLVVTTHGGDVWVVSGIDDKLENLEWKRFAAGLYEPFGVIVVDDKVYVTCKDGLQRLHDFNGDGEVDFYECFSQDTDVSTFFHAYNFDLQRDKDGNFYYAKSGQYTDHALPGAVIKITPEGVRSVYCTGFRTPNGMGMTPDGFPTVSDNQGNWMPASKVSLCKPGGFYGYVQTHARPGSWAPDGGRIDPKKVKIPETFDQPIIWMPQEFDNSSGGQAFVNDPRWGPLSGKLLHTSFGKGWLYYFMIQDFGDIAQSAIVKLPLNWLSGIQRASVNPKDGQVYAVGLNGWNGGGRKGLGEGCVQRCRYTGIQGLFLVDWKVRKGGLELKFDFELDPSSAKSPSSYSMEQWNYKWQSRYGSIQWSARNPEQKGHDPVKAESVRLAKDRRSVFLSIPDIQPVNQLKLEMKLKSTAGDKFQELVYMTIHRVPE